MKKKIIAFITAVMCCMGSVPLTAMANDPAPHTMIQYYMDENGIDGRTYKFIKNGNDAMCIEVGSLEDAEKVKAYIAEYSFNTDYLGLIVKGSDSGDLLVSKGENIVNTAGDIAQYIEKNKITGYIYPTEGNAKLVIVCKDNEGIAQVKAFVKEKGYNTDRLVFMLPDFEVNPPEAVPTSLDAQKKIVDDFMKQENIVGTSEIRQYKGEDKVVVILNIPSDEYIRKLEYYITQYGMDVNNFLFTAVAYDAGDDVVTKPSASAKEDSRRISDDVKEQFRVYETYSDENTKPERRLVKDFKNIMRCYNVGIRLAFTESSNIDDVLAGKYMLEKYYVVEYEDGSKKFYNENLEELKSISTIPEKAWNTFFDRDFVTNHISPDGAEDVYFLSGESNMMGTAIYYKTNKGDYVYYCDHHVGEALFPSEEFFKYQKALSEEYAKHPNDNGGAVDVSGVFDISKYLISAPSESVKGDANCDGNVNMSDAVLIMQAIANPAKYDVNGTDKNHITEQGKLNADIAGNNDGVTNADALAIQKKLLGIKDETGEIKYSVSIDWGMGGFADNIYDICSGSGRSAVITSTEELKAYFKPIFSEKTYDSAMFEYLEMYNDSYFKNNVLLVDSVNQGAGTDVGYKVESVTADSDKITVSLRNTLDFNTPAACVMSVCIVKVTIPKEAYNGKTVEWKKTADDNGSINATTPLSQPVGVKSIDEAVSLINSYKPESYEGSDREGIRKMYEGFKNDSFILRYKDNEADKIEMNGMALMPYMNYEDSGILYHVTYKGKKYQIYYYLNDSAYSGKTMKDYIDSRLTFKMTKTVDSKYFIMDNSKDGNSDISAFYDIDGKHYCKVRTFGTEDDLMELVNVLECEKVSLSADKFRLGYEEAENSGTSKESVMTAQRLAVKCEPYCKKGETLIADIAMGDLNYDESGQRHYEFEIFSAFGNYSPTKSDDKNLIVNGQESSIKKVYTADEEKALNINGKEGQFDSYRHETAELDFSKYSVGATGKIVFSFLKVYDEDPEHPSTTGAGQSMYFYVGEKGVAFGKKNSYEAKRNYQVYFNGAVPASEAARIEWNGKSITYDLYEEIYNNGDKEIAITPVIDYDMDFVYEGKTLDEYRLESEAENLYCNKLRELLQKTGEVLKYGELVYTTGTPDGVKWTKEEYNKRVAYFTEEVLAKYIVDGEFLKDKLQNDIKDFKYPAKNKYIEADRAFRKSISDNAVKILEAKGIKYDNQPHDFAYSYLNCPLIIYATAEEFKSLSLENVQFYRLYDPSDDGSRAAYEL